MQAAIPQTQLMLAGGQITGLALTPAQQQLLLQQAQAQAQLLAAAVQQHSAGQQHGAAGAAISASAATPMTQIPLSQPIQIAQVSERRGGASACPLELAPGARLMI